MQVSRGLPEQLLELAQNVPPLLLVLLLKELSNVGIMHVQFVMDAKNLKCRNFLVEEIWEQAGDGLKDHDRRLAVRVFLVP